MLRHGYHVDDLMGRMEMDDGWFGRHYYQESVETDYQVGEHCARCAYLSQDHTKCIAAGWLKVPRGHCYPLENKPEAN